MKKKDSVFTAVVLGKDITTISDEKRAKAAWRHLRSKNLNSVRQAETAAVNELLDSHTSGDFYRFMHHLRTFVAF